MVGQRQASAALLNVDSRPAQSKPGTRFCTSGRLTLPYRTMEGLLVIRQNHWSGGTHPRCPPKVLL